MAAEEGNEEKARSLFQQAAELTEKLLENAPANAFKTRSLLMGNVVALWAKGGETDKAVERAKGFLGEGIPRYAERKLQGLLAEIAPDRVSLHPVVLPHVLKLLAVPGPCAFCEDREAVWDLRGDAVCSFCYLYHFTAVGVSESFRAYVSAVEDDRAVAFSRSAAGHLSDLDEMNHLLGVLVLTNRHFTLEDRHAAAARSAGARAEPYFRRGSGGGSGS
jgi:hypothetical protein